MRGTDDTATDPKSLTPETRLALAFRDAAYASLPIEEVHAEALEVERLLIVADATFEALSRLADHWHRSKYGPTSDSVLCDERSINEGYDIWFDGGQLLEMRCRRLQGAGCDFEAIDRFNVIYARVWDILDEITQRERLERTALRTDRLAAIAAKLAAVPAPPGEGQGG